MGAFKNAAGKPVLMRMVKGIQDNKAYLGEVDGLIGDGDHGMNMNKGFSVFEERFKDEDISFSEGLDELGMILLNEIGGSMGPIYGTIFMDMAEEVSPDGISSSVVVTGSWISDTTLTIRSSVKAVIAGQSLMLGPNLISTLSSATP